MKRRADHHDGVTAEKSCVGEGSTSTRSPGDGSGAGVAAGFDEVAFALAVRPGLHAIAVIVPLVVRSKRSPVGVQACRSPRKIQVISWRQMWGETVQQCRRALNCGALHVMQHRADTAQFLTTAGASGTAVHGVRQR